MTWTELLEEDFLLQLTDGFLAVPPLMHRSGTGRLVSHERQVADYLYRRAKACYKRAIGATAPTSVDVWMVGSHGWIERGAPEPIRSIAEGETNDGYRIVIVGESTGAAQYISGWSDWLYTAGMKKKKRHVDLTRFHDAGRALLGYMLDSRSERPKCPTQALSHFHVPITHTGDSAGKT